MLKSLAKRYINIALFDPIITHLVIIASQGCQLLSVHVLEMGNTSTKYDTKPTQ